MKWFKRPRHINHAGEVEYDYENSVEIHKYRGRDPVVVSFETDDMEDLPFGNGNRGSRSLDVIEAAAQSNRTENTPQGKGNMADICCSAGESLEPMQADYNDPRESRAPFEVPPEEQIGEKIFSIEPADDLEFDRALSDEDRTSQTSLSLHEARGMGPIRDRQEWKKNVFDKMYILMGISCLLLAAFIGAIAVLVPRNKAYKSQSMTSSINSSSGNSTNSTNTNSTSSGAAVVSDRALKIRELLVNTSIALLSDDSTPQGKALNWIDKDDPADLPGENATAEIIRERFALACLYFATNGAEWTSNLGFLSEDSICNWNDGESLGVFCDDSAKSPVTLRIEQNNLNGGSIPGDLNYLSGLQLLSLYNNQITGAIPDLSQLVNLETLYLDSNLLSGMTPTSLFNLPNIVELFLLNNKNLTGTIPEISSASRLESISLSECSFTGSLPTTLGNVTSLRLLQLENNAISGTIPSALFALPDLESVGLHGNRLTGRIPSFGSTAFVSISLGANELDGPLPDGIDQLGSLQLFYAHENRLTGSIRSELVNLPSLQHLWLHSNLLTGELPDFSGSSTALEDVYLSGNDLAGDLDEFLATALSTIVRIDVSGNSRIGGSVSSDIGRFASSLQYFNASYCALTGSLPSSSLSDLTRVTTFAVAGNALTNKIPSEIGNMVELTLLDLSLNAFTGDIPDELSSLTGLTYLDVSKNPFLSGDLSTIVCDTLGGDAFSMLAADCSVGDTVSVDCDCCTLCCNAEQQCTPQG